MEGSPDYKVTMETSVTLAKGKKVPVYYYAGDQWGNFEAVAYFEEKNTINFLVFNSRKRSDFDKYLSGFKQLVGSYSSSGSLEPVDDKTFKKLVQDAMVAAWWQRVRLENCHSNTFPNPDVIAVLPARECSGPCHRGHIGDVVAI